MLASSTMRTGAAPRVQLHKTASISVASPSTPLTRNITVRRGVASRAAPEEGTTTTTSQPAAGSQATPPLAPATKPLAPATPQPTPIQPESLFKGQGTAIVTGAISIIFGVAYLALVYVMDSRGGQMMPPPPEALGL